MSIQPSIHQLPEHVVNALKAGEIVERPQAVVKELIENALDAGASGIRITLIEGGIERIRVEDDGSGISEADLPLTVQRYATSKLTSINDLHSLSSYGFRGEALASIAQVSTTSLHTRNIDTDLTAGVALQFDGNAITQVRSQLLKTHGTILTVDTLFATVPARRKFLKSSRTEWNYCKQTVVAYTLRHWNMAWSLEHNGKNVLDLKPAGSLMERCQDLYASSMHDHWRPVEFCDEQIHVYGLVGDAGLHFTSQQYLTLFVNGRPVNDRLIKRAVMEAYYRQLTPGTFPFVVLFIDIDPALVDVNVHPRKSEVKFLDPGSIYNLIYTTLQSSLGDQKVNYAAFTKAPVQHGLTNQQFAGLQNIQQQQDNVQLFANAGSLSSPSQTLYPELNDTVAFANDQIVILGQLWDTYIVAQGVDTVYYVDQHALAERVTFEKMKVRITREGLSPTPMLNPWTTALDASEDGEHLAQTLQNIGFDASMLSQSTLVVHATPQVFQDRAIDLDLVVNWMRGETPEGSNQADESSIDRIFRMLDEMIGMKACKASITANQKLSHTEMRQLLQDGMDHVKGMFVCQHGRPSVVKIERKYVDALFDRH